MFFELDGLEVVKEVCKISYIFIIMFFVKDSEFDKVIGLEIGVDDYVIKFFLNCEFLVWVKVYLWCIENIEIVVVEESV